MGKTFSEIDASAAAFIERQRMFFVATAPLDAAGRLNLSPKGLDTFRILDPRTVAYLDLTGSGIETVAHLRENGRIALLFCAFEGPPKILRLHGRGAVIEPGDEGFEALRARFPAAEAVRCVIRIAVDRVSDSCGYGVPLYSFAGERPQLSEWARRKGPEGVELYRANNNRESVDGLPGLRSVADAAGAEPKSRGAG